MYCLKKVYLIFTLLLCLFAYGQNTIQTYLDSLKKIPVSNIEKKIGFQQKAQDLLHKIDTSNVSIEQVDLILKYLRYNSVKAEEYPFPLALWVKKASEQLQYNDGIIRSLNTLGDLNRLSQNDQKESLSYYKQVLNIYEKQNDLDNIAYIQDKISLSYMSAAAYDESIAMLLKSLKIYKKTNNKQAIVTSYHNLGDVFLHAHDTINSLKYFKLSAELEKQYPIESIRTMNASFLGQIYLHQKQLKLAKHYFEYSNQLIKKNGKVPYLLVYNLRDLGVICELQNNLTEATTYYKKSLAITYNSNNTINLTIAAADKLAGILIKEKKYAEAVTLIEDVYANKILKNYRDSYVSKYISFFEKSAVAHQKLKNYEKSLFYTKKHIEAIKQLNKVSILKNINELEKKYQSKIDKQQIQLLKNENNIKSRNTIILLLSLLGTALLLVFIYIYNRQKTKTLLNKSLLAKLALEKEKIANEKLKTEKELADAELALKQRELTTNSISLLQKAEQYETIINQLKEIKPLVDTNPKALTIINNLMSHCMSSKSAYNWEEFKVTFEKVHTTFYNNILKKHPNLSANEKKLCAFLKLGLNTKDISAITQQNNRTIVVARSRLRKKLGINKEENLINYIANF